MPEILYWGAPLSGSVETLKLALQRPVPQARLDQDVPLSLLPELAKGQYGSPGLEGHRANKDWFASFTTVAVQEHASTLNFVCEDAIAKLSLTIHLELDESGVLSLSQTITNTSVQAYNVQRLALTLPIPRHIQELRHFRGRWTREFQTEVIDWRAHNFVQENRRGRTSHENFPGLIAGQRGHDEQQGEVYAVHLGWSGNHRIKADVKSDGRRLIQAEELLDAGEISLAAGESYSTPVLYASYSAKGLNALSQQFHAFVRQNILHFPVSAKRPVHLNTWEGIYFDHDPNYIIKMIEASAKMGVERFIIDDGWFVGRHDDKAALGDWQIDADKYPEGFTPIVDAIHANGMEFGLWVEPEMVNKESTLYRQHPEWMLSTQGYEQLSGRWQYLLDLQQQPVFDYLLDCLDKILSAYPITYLKWDMNRELLQSSHMGRAAVHGQTQAFYRLLEALRAKHPNVEVESCSSGGGRIDYGVLQRTQRFWTSDNNDALERQIIQKGMSYFFPPEVMGSHIGPAHCHTTMRRHAISFRGITALFGHMGVELDPLAVDEQERQAFSHYIALHKQWRDLLHSGLSYRVELPDEQSQAQVVVAIDQQQALVAVAQLAMPAYAIAEVLRIPGLQAQQIYRLSVLDQPENLPHIMKQLPLWMSEGLTISGEQLEKAGLQLPVLDPETALLFSLEAIN
ncbi:alpha-galactosidase [Alginatibacterium sediminis]|uniref:Alpha-galactosidase n=2 Tax=Alginatibacterium sediminis TaxID=2164068 RepID=A0A420E824_9ALTE|nr:alpha-galactosidase [Alginatibacterium sediminis]